MHWRFYSILLTTMANIAMSAIPPENTLLWPQPQERTVFARIGYVAGPSKFSFQQTGGKDSQILAAAFARYRGILFQHPPSAISWAHRCVAAPCPPAPPSPNHSLVVQALVVSVANSSETLGEDTDESYNLSVTYPQATLSANSVFGAIRGLETFSQLMQVAIHPSVVIRGELR